MSKQQLVSIAMTTYNGESYLREQLDSIYTQTYKNLEVIVCDDRSTDETHNILEEYKQRSGLEYFINETNLGCIRNFEKAISLCRGNYIALADQDDIWLPEKIETLVNEIKDYSLICSDAKLIDKSGKIISESFRKQAQINVVTDKPLIYMLFYPFVTGCTCMFRKKLIEKAFPIPENTVWHDWWLAIIAAKENKIKYIDKQLVLYRQHGNNQTTYEQKDPFLIRMLMFLLFDASTSRRKEFFSKTRQKFQNLLNTGTVFNEHEKIFIQDTIRYLNSRINNDFNADAIRFMFRNNDILFKNKKEFMINLLTYAYSGINNKVKTV